MSDRHIVELRGKHESVLERFLLLHLGIGYWGIRIEHDVLTLKVLPMHEGLLCKVLDYGNYVYETLPPLKTTGVTSIAILGYKRAMRSRSVGRRLSVVKA